MPLLKPTKKLLSRTPKPLKKLLFVSRLGISGSTSYLLEQRFLEYLQKRQGLAAMRALFKSNNVKKALNRRGLYYDKISERGRLYSGAYLKAAMKTTKWELSRELTKTSDLKRLYDFFKGGYKNIRQIKGQNKNQPVGIFTNSSWLVGYKRGTPNGTLFTKNSSFTVPGLTDNMIDRMVVAPGAGKYLWNTLWLHKRRNKPDKAIKRTFSSAFMAEYTKRQQAFKRG